MTNLKEKKNFYVFRRTGAEQPRKIESDKFVERPDLLSIGTSSHVSDPPPPWPIIQCYMLHYIDAPSLL